VDWQDIGRLRSPGFTLARRGYDKHEVDKFLEQLVEWLETDAAEDIGQVAITRKLELVGKSTAHILLTTEQESQELRRQAAEDCDRILAEAQEAREAADAYATQVRAKADEDARQMREEATAEASENLKESLHRRAQIDDQIQELVADRDSMLEELMRLRVELSALIDEHRSAPAAKGNGDSVTEPPATEPFPGS
jgi:DivIVA domain-containing protein